MSTVAEWKGHAEDDEDDAVLPEPETFYGSADEFVREFLVVTYRREVSPKGEYRWHGRWWMHPEAVARIEALWRTWEHYRQDGTTGMSAWWRDHADHHMGVLIARRARLGSHRVPRTRVSRCRTRHRRPGCLSMSAVLLTRAITQTKQEPPTDWWAIPATRRSQVVDSAKRRIAHQAAAKASESLMSCAAEPKTKCYFFLRFRPKTLDKPIGAMIAINTRPTMSPTTPSFIHHSRFRNESVTPTTPTTQSATPASRALRGVLDFSANFSEAIVFWARWAAGPIRAAKAKVATPPAISTSPAISAGQKISMFLLERVAQTDITATTEAGTDAAAARQVSLPAVANLTVDPGTHLC